MKINGRDFNEAFCRRFTPERLRKVYNGESVETLDSLIEALYPTEEPAGEKPEFLVKAAAAVESVEVSEKKKTRKKKA